MKLPVLITRGITIFPSIDLSLDIGRDISINAIELADNEKDLCSENETFDNQILVVPQKKDEDDVINKIDQFYQFGTLAKIIEKKKLSDDKNAKELTIRVLGQWRVSLKDCEFDETKNTFVANFDKISNRNVSQVENIDLKAKIIKILKEIKQTNNQTYNLKDEEIEDWNNQANFTLFVDYIVNRFNFNLETNIYFIKESNVTLRLKKLEELLTAILNEIKNSNKQKIDQTLSKKVDTEINNKINSDLNKQQREFYLREKLKAIRDELNDGDEEDSVDKIREKVEANPYPEHIKKRILSELKKYENTQQMQEASMIKAYIDWLVNLPWWQTTQDNNDIANVEKVLNENHYGLTKVKERIVEYLAVQARSKKSKAPIICLVGPPGVGKTSLAFSIAQSLNKKCVKVSLGGVKDEAEIRGHRRTYLGSMPGRIISGMKKAEVVNPVFILDEIDKMSSDYKGDPASAMLEVLDPEQNTKFSDNYIEEEYDLSKAMFIATANYADQIPEALYDRMEIIELTSYTENEKASIAKSYLIPKTLNAYELNNNELSFTDDAIKYIIRYYTREAGVRELERLIQRIARKFIVRLDKKELEKEVIDVEAVKHYLKKEIFDYTKKDKKSIPGVVNGMAYTNAGGDLLPIEVSYSKGKGDVTITGNLKETMNESAKVALGFVKANAEKYHIDPEIFSKIDIHIHVPSGGIPKDGPSAGVTLTTALLSSLKQCAVPTTISMTGEITLRGQVGIIGGVKEKTISAYRGGVREIFIPREDEKFLDDVPSEIKDEITFHLVDIYDDIYNILFKKFDEDNKNNHKIANN
ncbi:MAG: endopeptidase La [Mycoplasmataceae bacterium]|nr:endopeptidase La [Mycoplasmataceae bacterium]